MRRAVALLLCAATAAAAADDARSQAEQRIALAARLIGDSPVAQRIGASGNAAAVSHLDESRLHLAHARDALAAGNAALARRAADEALMHLGHARRMVPDAPARTQALRLRVEQQQAALERLLEAWRARSGGDASPELIAATGLIGNARVLGQDGRHEEALRELAAAQERLVGGMGRLFATRELDYTARASGPVEQFALERAQLDAYVELLPLALAQLQPRPDARTLIERYRQSAAALRTQAEQQLERGENADALAKIRSATVYAQRALAAAGVLTPADTGSNP